MKIKNFHDITQKSCNLKKEYKEVVYISIPKKCLVFIIILFTFQKILCDFTKNKNFTNKI